jgi:hemerythrin superfamily protein
MDAIKMLTQQHRRMEAAFKALAEASPSKRTAQFPEAADLLMSHVLVEERVFYPAINAKRTEDILLESLEEHLSLKRLLADLVELKADDPSFEAKLHVLEEQAEHHHEEEEEKLFPKVKKLLSAQELDELGAKMAAAQNALLTQAPRDLASAQTDEAASLE